MPAKKVSTKTTTKKSGKTKTTTSKKNTKTTKSTKTVAKNTKETTTPVPTDTLQAELDEQQLKLELLTEEFDDLVTAIGEMKKRHAKEFSELVNRAKQLRKNSLKDIKQLNRQLGKKRKKNKNRKPCGFQSPSAISKQLAKFLGEDEGVKIARTAVTKFITTYVKEHNLQKPENKRVILPDSKLKKLLNPPEDKELTYFNLQTYLVPHFPKKESSSKA